MARLADPDLAERRRGQILEAALLCFRRRGFHQATMHEICAEAAISPGSLYRYFDSKTDIIAAIAEEERRDADLAFADVERGGVIDRLCAVAAPFFTKIEAGDGGLIAEVLAEAARDPLLGQTLARIDAKVVAACARMIALAQLRGEVDPDLDPIDATHTLFAAIEGLGLRRGVLNPAQIRTAAAQFRVLAERYLKAPA